MKLLFSLLLTIFTTNALATGGMQICDYEDDKVKIETQFVTGDPNCYASSCLEPLESGSIINLTLKELNYSYQFSKTDFQNEIGIWHLFGSDFIFGASIHTHYVDAQQPDKKYYRLSIDSNLTINAVGGSTIGYEGLFKVKFSYKKGKSTYGSYIASGILNCTSY